MKTKLLILGLGALGGLAFGAGEATHLVKPGETLWSISREHGVSVESLREANGLPGNVIAVGASLEIPGGTAEAPGSHPVAPGENLFRIGQRYGVSVPSLMEWNGLARPEDLRSGSLLRLSGVSARTEVREPAAKAAKPPVVKKQRKEPVADPLAPMVLNESVRYGDLAKRHGTTVSQLNELNGWSFLKSDLLAAGSEVYVPR